MSSNDAEDVPAGIVTVVGTVAEKGLLLSRFTVSAELVGVLRVIVIVPPPLSSVTNTVGIESVKAAISSSVTLTLAEADGSPMDDAVMVAD